ncbi:MAG: response regulator [Gammaproteobacteria bacterium]|nr:response regulator [Gammaproteobacteria bacterium]
MSGWTKWSISTRNGGAFALEWLEPLGWNQWSIWPEYARDYHKRAYRVVLRLLTAGLLEKSKDISEFARYKKTPLFVASVFKQRVTVDRGPKQPRQPKQPTQVEHGAPSLPVKDPCIRDELDQLVKTYQVDLLSSIGESEEYLRLHQTYPQLKAKLEPHYLKSRDVSSKILGKIRAIESVLAGMPKDPVS